MEAINATNLQTRSKTGMKKDWKKAGKRRRQGKFIDPIVKVKPPWTVGHMGDQAT